MSDSETPKKALGNALLAMSEKELASLRHRLEEQKTSLEDLNSLFPATREFLEQRGLTNVRQLDKEGMEELFAHLIKLQSAL